MEMTRMFALAAVAAAAAAEESPRWTRPWDMEAETEFSRDRQESPWNHFLLDGQQGFVSGREFYQASGDISPFLWPNHPFLRFGTDRSWQSDTNSLEVRLLTGNEVGDALLQELPAADGRVGANRTPLTTGDVSWSPFQELRLHAGLDQNDHSTYRTYPFRFDLAGPDKREALSWFGGNLPPKSQATLGGAFERRGSRMALQANQGWWWTQSPASGFPYPWEGFNADFLYKPGDDFELSLIEQRWDSPLDRPFYRAHWRRSELDMGITGSSRGGWFWRLDVGFQRREMVSDSLFQSFLEQTYPTRFRYRQAWSAPDSIPLQMLSSGSMGFRERMIHVQHATEFRETWGTHQPRQILKAYWRHPMSGYRTPVEFFPADSTWSAQTHPGRQARGVSGEAEFREKRKTFEIGVAGTYAMEWDAPVFHLEGLDSTAFGSGYVFRRGAYRGSGHSLRNAAGRLFAGGNLPAQGFWKAQAGWREFRGADAGSMEFRPSRYWAGGGAGFRFPSDLRVEGNAHYMGDKEVRGWGPVFTVPAHFENNLTLEQTLMDERLKVSLSALHAFGEDIREQPNGNPVRFRILAGLSGTIY